MLLIATTRKSVQRHSIFYNTVDTIKNISKEGDESEMTPKRIGVLGRVFPVPRNDESWDPKKTSGYVHSVVPKPKSPSKDDKAEDELRSANGMV